MGSSSLRWSSDRGFELDVEASDDEVAVRLVGVPVPADGTVELRAGIDLDRLDILFKASVEIQGETAQLQDVRVRLVDDDGGLALELAARCEDVETGDIVPFHAQLPIELPAGAPEAGGPRPMPTNEDELDWEDETTLEQLVVNAPETPMSADERPDAASPQKGLQALLKALESLDEEDEPTPQRASQAAPRPAPTALGSQDEPDDDLSDEADGPESEEGDQSLGAGGEARSLLEMLMNSDHLELEDDGDVGQLIEGVVRILAAPMSNERKATKLSEWLLAQPAVADLFIGDDDLAEILERW